MIGRFSGFLNYQLKNAKASGLVSIGYSDETVNKSENARMVVLIKDSVLLSKVYGRPSGNVMKKIIRFGAIISCH